MTIYDFYLLLAHSALKDPKSALNEKWKDEEAIAIARETEAACFQMQ